MRNGMAQDYSWINSAREYVKVYERAGRSSSSRRMEGSNSS